MHMADALISPAVGGAMWAAAGGLIVYSARKLRNTLDERRVPLMGVLGAFVFAAQMINFTIPATGSSGHLGGGLLLAILLGPQAALITIASILTVQAFFFADGGLLALGCNIVNMGLFPCFLVYPLLYVPLAGRKATSGRLTLACIVGAVVGLQLGAFAVVGETMASGISELPFAKFVLLMQPIHLAIGVVEGLAIATVVNFVWKARPEILELAPGTDAGRVSFRPAATGLLVAALVTGGVVSWFASAHPDGLEWAIGKTTGKEALAEPADGIRGVLKQVQEKTALLPGYDFAKSQEPAARTAVTSETASDAESTWGAPKPGTSVAGLVGGGLSLLLAIAAAWFLKGRKPATGTN